jgi:H+/Cl- antiporter ClcA
MNHVCSRRTAGEAKMLWTIVLILAAMWLLWTLTSYSAGGRGGEEE